MFDMSWGEVMVIGGVALVVIGPKDLPKALRTVGQMTTKVRRMASEFQAQFNEAMREAELDDVRREVEGLNRDVATATSAAFNPIQTIRDEIKGSVQAPVAAAPLPYAPSPADVMPLPAEEPAPPPDPVEETGPAHHIERAPEPADAPIAPDVPPLPPDLTGPGLEPPLAEPRGHAA